ncbi:MAG: NAD(+)/NADH kinase [Ruminococcus sp.]|nr:NAD(+)/NADH kinase [Ruminococcus sp.]CDE31193.1 probable inorganic polyphosphate/ATP-NAD kinase [Ruminococcus sp. CAG:403]
MNAVIFPNFQKIGALPCAREVCELLHVNGIAVTIDPQYQNEFSNQSYVQFQDFTQAAKEADFAIAIGGDGTILHCAKHLMGTDTKLLGINMGRLGFMASMERNELYQIRRLKTGDYRVSKRMLLCGDLLDQKGHVIQHYTALNEICISRQFSKILDFSVYRKDILIGSYRADGIIFSTPTGSTAYALSAGGPIIEPELLCIEMTLICPHSVTVRPVLFSEDSQLCLTLKQPAGDDVYICIDGDQPVPLDAQHRLQIYRSPYEMHIIDLSGNTFFDSLNQKMIQTIKGQQTN